MKITLEYTIDDTKIQDFKNAFFRVFPIPTDKDGNPTHNELDWIKKIIKDYLLVQYNRGTELLSKDQITTNEDIVQ